MHTFSTAFCPASAAAACAAAVDDFFAPCDGTTTPRATGVSRALAPPQQGALHTLKPAEPPEAFTTTSPFMRDTLTNVLFHVATTVTYALGATARAVLANTDAAACAA
jgi:hypothetical protein